MIQAIAFDAFGTLLRIPNPQYPHQKFLSEIQAIGDPNRLITKDYASVHDMAADFGCYDKTLIQKLKEEIDQELDRVELFPETLAVLASLKQSGYKLALVSNLSTEYQVPIQRLGLEPYFDVLAYSFRVGSRKPEPEIFDYVARSLGVPVSDLLMVGDSYKSDFKGAAALGISALLLDRRQKYTTVPSRVDHLNGVLAYLQARDAR